MKKCVVLVLALLLILPVMDVLASGKRADVSGAKAGAMGGGTLVVSLNAEPTHLDHQLQKEFNIMWATDPLNGFLLRFNKEQELEPELATDWEVLSETEIKMSLRKGAKFHNGREVKAQDVKASIERILTDDMAVNVKDWVSSVDSVDVLDDYTFVIKLKNPDATVLGGLTMVAIVPIEEVEKRGDLKTNPIGCGPFKFDSWEKGSRVKYVKNPDYFEEGLPRLDELIFVFQPEYGAEISSLRSGDVDIVLWLNAQDVVAWRESMPKGIKMDDGGSIVMSFHFFGFNMAEGPFADNEKLRLAVKYALDRTEVADISLQGTGPEKVSHIGKQSEYYNPDWEYEPNLEKAKQLLAEAGYPDGLTVDHYAPKTPLEEPMAQVYKAQLAKIGIDLDLKVLEVPSFIDVCYVRLTYTTFTCGGESFADPAIIADNAMKTGGAWNNFGFSNPQIDAWLTEARQTFDVERRKELYDKVEQWRIDNAAPYIVCTNGTRFAGLTERVQGWKSQNNIRYDFSEVWVTE
jgi:ABC-type transport system substrate-binding protein